MAESHPPLAGIPQSVQIRWYLCPLDQEVFQTLDHLALVVLRCAPKGVVRECRLR